MKFKFRLPGFFVFAFVFWIFPLSLLSAEPSKQRDDLILSAKNYLGTPYRYGGTSRAGIDCSGFVYMAALDAGVAKLPRTAQGIYNKVEKIPDSERITGDLVFFTVNRRISHVGIYLGDGKFIHSASDGPSTGVIISKLSENYWKNHYFASGRFISTEEKKAEATEEKSAQENRGITQETKSESKLKAEQKPKAKSKQKAKPEQKTATKKENGTENKAKPENKKNTEENGTNFTVDITGFFNWGINQAEKNPFVARGGSARMDIRTVSWAINPGLFAELDYLHNENNSFSQNITIPIGTSLSLKKFMGIYAGIVVPFEQNEESVEKNKSTIQTVFGVKFQGPEMPFGKITALFTQDISYNCKFPFENEKATSPAELIGTNLVMKTGLTFRFKS